MRRIDGIIVHCSATPEGREVSVDDIRGWHRQRGFNDIGYHWVVGLDGEIHAGRPERLKGAHCLNHNEGTLGICYVGGVSANDVLEARDTRTAEQKAALRDLIATKIAEYPAIVDVSGHREYANKACPCFAARAEYAGLLEGRGTPPAPAIIEAATVRAAQALLRAKGYPEVGRADGDMGSKTRGALLAFKADNGLPLTADLDDATMAALVKASARAVAPERSRASLADLRQRGSRTIAATDMLKAGGTVGGGAVAVGGVVDQTGVLDQLGQAGDVATQVNSFAAAFRGLLATLGEFWWLAVVAILVAGAWYAWRAASARLDDHRSGKTA